VSHFPGIPPFTVDVPSGVSTLALTPGDPIDAAVAARVLAVKNGPTEGWVSFTYADGGTEDDVFLAAGEPWPIKLVKAVRQPSAPGGATPASPRVYLILG
jgi:hypothetical protein